MKLSTRNISKEHTRKNIFTKKYNDTNRYKKDNEAIKIKSNEENINKINKNLILRQYSKFQ